MPGVMLSQEAGPDGTLPPRALPTTSIWSLARQKQGEKALAQPRSGCLLAEPRSLWPSVNIPTHGLPL